MSPDYLKRDIRKAVAACAFIRVQIFIFSACSGSGQDATSTGSLAFKAVWPNLSEDGTSSRDMTTEGTPDICAATISAAVLDVAGSEIGIKAGTYLFGSQVSVNEVVGIYVYAVSTLASTLEASGS